MKHMRCFIEGICMTLPEKTALLWRETKGREVSENSDMLECVERKYRAACIIVVQR